jgi:5-methyltetrahydrofolate--homocysteine methyltransferase
MELTVSHQLVPEQSTIAIITHHPQAKYYAVRGAPDPGGQAIRSPLAGARTGGVV